MISSSSLDGVKILLVDDRKENLLALEGLIRRADIEIFSAKSGAEALEFMLVHEFCLAILDVQMPGMSGFELAKLMRGVKISKKIPIIFVTASTENQSQAFDGYESGAVDFLLKPLDNHVVKNKVNIFVELYLQKKNLRLQLENLSRSQKQQEVLLGILQKTQLELEKAVQIRDEFMSIASHELKTPLTSLKMQTQLSKRNLKKGGLSGFTLEKLMRLFDDEEKQLDRITHLIDNMLDVSRIGSGNLVMDLELFDICELTREIVGRCSEQFIAAHCPITLTTCEMAWGTWDRFRLEQVIVNLLTNAMRYGAGSPIVVQVSDLGSSVQITVQDQGQGIASENHERIFQKFERAASETQVCGLGLGLYIVAQILENHCGSIQVDSKLGHGATFKVNLPRLEQNLQVQL